MFLKFDERIRVSDDRFSGVAIASSRNVEVRLISLKHSRNYSECLTKPFNIEIINYKINQ